MSSRRGRPHALIAGARRPATRPLVLVPILVGALLAPAVGRTEQASPSPAQAQPPSAQSPPAQSPPPQAPATQAPPAQAPPAQPSPAQPPAAQAPRAQPPARTAPDFKLSASPENLTVRRGATGKITVKVEPVAGFNGRVDLLSSLLYGTTMEIAPRAIENGSGVAVLTIAPTASAIKGTYTVSITGTNLAMGHSMTVLVTVK